MDRLHYGAMLKENRRRHPFPDRLLHPAAALAEQDPPRRPKRRPLPCTQTASSRLKPSIKIAVQISIKVGFRSPSSDDTEATRSLSGRSLEASFA
jgi:hypothetical protein